MPLKYQATPPPPEEVTDDRGYVSKYGPTVIRGVGGLFGFTPLTGALAGGIADVPAQMLEKGTINPLEVDPKHVASEAAVGAVMGKYAKGLSALVKGSKAGLAALKGGIYGGSAPVISHTINEGDPNPLNYPGEVALGAGLGAATGGGAVKLLGGGKVPKADVAPTPTTPPPSPTYRGKSGLRVALDDLRKVPQGNTRVTPEILTKHQALAAEQVRNPKGPIAAEIGPPVVKPSLVELEQLHDEGNKLIGKNVVASEKAQGAALKEKVDAEKAHAAANKLVGGEQSAAAKAQAAYVKGHDDARDKAMLANTQRWLAEKRAAAKATENQTKLDAIAAEKAGRNPTDYSIREGVSATKPDGTKQNMSRSFIKEEAEDAAKGVPIDTPQAKADYVKRNVYKSELEARREGMTVGATGVSRLGRGKYVNTFDDPKPLTPDAPVVPVDGPTPSGVADDLPLVDESAPVTYRNADAANIVAKESGGVVEALPDGTFRVNPPEAELPPANTPEPPPDVPPADPLPAAAPPDGPLPVAPAGAAAEVVEGGASALDDASRTAIERIKDEMSSQPYQARTWTHLGEGEGKTGNAAGGASNIISGHGGAPVYHDILKAAGLDTKKTHRSHVLEAIEAVLTGSRIRPNNLRVKKLAEAVKKVAGDRLNPPVNPDVGNYNPTPRYAKPISKAKPVVPDASPEEAKAILQEGAQTLNKANPPVAEVPFALGSQVAKGAKPVTPDLFKGSALENFVEGAKLPVATVPDAPQGSPARFFKSPLEAAGEGYGAVKAAKAAGEKVPEEGRRAAAQAAQRLNKESKAAQPKVDAPPSDDAWIKEEMDFLAKAGKKGVKAKAKKGTTLGALGAGSLGDFMEAVRNNPEFASQALYGAGGAAAGAALNEDDPLAGALMGGGAGIVGGTLASRGPGILKQGGSLKDVTDPVVSRIPNYMRGALLSDPRSILHNSFAGPWGSNFFGGLEQFGKGVVSGDDIQKETGKQALKGAANVPKWLKGWKNSLDEAKQKIDDVEDLGRAGKFMDPENPNIHDRIAKVPATYMLAGDLNTRNVLGEAGVPEDLTRRITLTAEPRRAMWKNFANWGKSKSGVENTGEQSTIAQMMLPFKRTAANIMESGFERTPIIGSIINEWGDKTLKIPMEEQLVQEGIGGIVWGLGYAAGANVNQDTAKTVKLQSLVSNLGGQYSLLASAGFMAGQAVKGGKAKPEAVATSFLRSYGGSGMPLPSTAPLSEAAAPIYKYLKGEDVKAKEFIPSSLKPKIWDAGQELANYIQKDRSGVLKPRAQGPTAPSAAPVRRRLVPSTSEPEVPVVRRRRQP